MFPSLGYACFGIPTLKPPPFFFQTPNPLLSRGLRCLKPVCTVAFWRRAIKPGGLTAGVQVEQSLDFGAGWLLIADSISGPAVC